MGARQGDGATLRTHLQRRAANTGKVDPLLTMQWPPAGLSLWLAFRGMARTQTLTGPGPISMTEIDAWQRVHGEHFNHWEIDMIKAFDAIDLEHQR